MKINWGTGIVIAFICFISFIMYFIIKMNTDSKYDHDLVIEEYYQAELGFQDEIDKEENSNKLTENISWKKTEDGLIITFPENLDSQDITGKVSLYRTSNKKLDFDMPISISNNQMLIPNNKLLDGRWNLKVDWQYKETSYLYKKEIMY
ncbi:FixH family protein [Xanthomarina spongicola]|uniref:FixH protein n=1 Tax=Xanthomarina spongicola TaxID=570520 RepID=A0A316DI71_9FLAO|nr:FixH family protein [Xanthomarina spongicola]PWK17864.1 FixH protein [Xanthomarina spongicola]